VILEGLRVLVIEDEAMIAMLIEDMLIELGCAIRGPAANVAGAMAIIAKGDFDAAVLDVNLGGERTMPIAAQLKIRGIPFVFATGYGASGIDKEFSEHIVLSKPFRCMDLEAALNQLSRNSTSSDRRLV
jgi:DNA-binding response OmpR family regulator